LELEKLLKKLREVVVNGGGPTNRGIKLMDSLESRITDLMNASEKLEVSAYCLIKAEVTGAPGT
jgi:hypothetical protein